MDVPAGGVSASYYDALASAQDLGTSFNGQAWRSSMYATTELGEVFPTAGTGDNSYYHSTTWIKWKAPGTGFVALLFTAPQCPYVIGMYVLTATGTVTFSKLKEQKVSEMRKPRCFIVDGKWHLGPVTYPRLSRDVAVTWLLRGCMGSTCCVVCSSRWRVPLNFF